MSDINTLKVGDFAVVTALSKDDRVWCPYEKVQIQRKNQKIIEATRGSYPYKSFRCDAETGKVLEVQCQHFYNDLKWHKAHPQYEERLEILTSAHEEMIEWHQHKATISNFCRIVDPWRALDLEEMRVVVKIIGSKK